MMQKRTVVSATLSTLTAVALAACGNLTAGGLTGKATVLVSGDADTLSAAALASPQPSLAGASREGASTVLRAAAPTSTRPALSAEEAEGELEVEFMAYLVDDAGEALQLGDEIHAQVDLRGRTETDVVDKQTIPATHYQEFRLIFTKIQAEVEGLVIDSVTVPEVHVELEHLSLLVSRSLDLDVTEGSQAELTVDLNSLAWLDAVDPITGAVDDSIFQELVNVDVVIR